MLNLLRLPILVVQLVLLGLLLTAYRLESESFRNLAYLIFAGFPVNHLLPMRFRLAFFVGLSIAGLVLVVGVPTGLWILAVGGALIAIAHLPIRFGARIVVMLTVVTALGVLRVGWVAPPWPAAIWPILGSMFMFRMFIYLYDLKHKNAPFSPLRATAYFFMVPNVCFPLFPVVDYTTFCRTYYNSEPFAIYQKGTQWILRGIVHLVLYRLIYQHLLIDPVDIASAGDLFWWMLTTYLLYLKISGLFHVIVGMLHLYGFNLPETHHLFLLSSSFTDFWRRINIYWKDFITKLIFYPVFFKLRKLGQIKAMAISTLIALFTTWVFHSYQWFWIRGSVLFTSADMLFWLILALLVTANTVWESRALVGSASKKELSPLRVTLTRSATTMATFFILTVLWSMWSADSLESWISVLHHAGTVSIQDALFIGGVLAVIGVAAALFGAPKRPASLRNKPPAPSLSWRTASLIMAGSFLLLLPPIGFIQDRLSPPVAKVMRTLEHPRLNSSDLAKLQRGYYEDLTQVHRFSHELSALYGERPPDWFDPWKEAMSQYTDTYYDEILLKSRSFKYSSASYTTNRWGMRDRDYVLKKPEGVYRIAVMGSSYTLGWGVNDAEVYESIAEEQFNRDNEASASGIPKYEILNFSVQGYGPVRKLMVLEERTVPFEPDAAFFICHANEEVLLTNNLLNRLRNNVELPYSFIEDIVEKADVDGETEDSVARLRLAPFTKELLAACLKQFVDECTERGITSVWVMMPQAAKWGESYAERVPVTLRMAEEAGFSVVLDLIPAFEGIPEEELKLYDWDYHPNAYGHSLLAKQLVRSLEEHALHR